ncbi:MAG: DNA polymerase III subunit alpha [Ruminococcus sp.]|jgi:DNA polymerase-3 subunit alpha|nr:DNA polymerase III subunit alpha [Ruminococcus sp.]
MKNFVHLHAKTEYTLLTSALRIKDYVKRVKALGQTAAAVTDRGVLYGVPEFINACKREGIKPIIGCETTPDGILLLCKNDTGYKNLIKISSGGGFHVTDLNAYDLNGLIGLSGGKDSLINRLMLDGEYREAKKIITKIKDLFDEFYIEILNHGLREEAAVLPLYIRLSNETECKLCATNDVCYTDKDGYETEQILTAIRKNRSVMQKDPDDIKNDSYYVKSYDEMIEAFPEMADAVEITNEIAENCNVTSIGSSEIHLPHFEIPGSPNNKDFLSALCHKGAKKRYGENLNTEIINRLNFELETINNMGLTDYFLIVWDFVKFAKTNSIPVGPGRGSGAGSLAAFCTGITNTDPIRYNLLFERFLNPERVTLPDFDIDFGDERRGEVIDYVINKYGVDYTAGIVTFGTLAAKNSIRDVCRVTGMPYSAGDYLAKELSKFGINAKLSDLKINGEWKETDPQLVKLLSFAEKCEGFPKNASTHAAGIVITDKPVTDYVPTVKNNDMTVTQYPMTELEALGLVKMDFLGLKALTVIDDTVSAIKIYNKNFSADKIPENDPETYRMLCLGDTAGVFQFESEGITSLLRRVNPSCIEDLIAVIALYRPGPMDSIPSFLENRRRPREIRYAHPILREVLAETYDVIVYQEQVMLLARKMASFTLGRADILRRAMSKKKTDVMEHEKSAFIEGCKKNNIGEGIALDIFSQIEKFASYAFNKSHAAAYAELSYKTAYLKRHFPAEFFAAQISAFCQSSTKLNFYVNAARRFNIKFLPPDILTSERKFKAVTRDTILFGFGALKGVGDIAIDEILSLRKREEITSCEDFCAKCDAEAVSRQTVESLIQAGAFDRFSVSRRHLMQYAAMYIDNVKWQKMRNISGQVSIFESGAKPQTQQKFLPEFDEPTKRQFQADILGVII